MRSDKLKRLSGEGATGGLYGWLLLALFMEYARPTSYFEFLHFPILYSVIPLSLFAVSIFSTRLRPMKEIVGDGLAKWVFIFLGLLLVSLVVAPNKQSAWSIFEKVLGYVILFLLISRIVTSIARLRGVFTVLLIAHLFLLAMNPEVILDPSTRHYIVGATFLGDGNDFSLSLCVMFPLAIELAQGGRKSWSKCLAWLSVGVIVLAIIGTQSRGATLGLAAVVSLYCIFSRHKFLTAIAATVVAIGVLLVYAPPEYSQRMGTITTYEEDGSAQGRIQAWKASLGMVFHNPLLGIGAGQFSDRMGKNTHSSYMMPLAELGLPGFACVLMMVFGNLRANLRLRRSMLSGGENATTETTVLTSRILLATGAAMLGFGVAGVFLSATYYPHLYVLSGVLISARIVASKETNLSKLPATSGKLAFEPKKRAARLHVASRS